MWESTSTYIKGSLVRISLADLQTYPNQPYKYFYPKFLKHWPFLLKIAASFNQQPSSLWIGMGIFSLSPTFICRNLEGLANGK
jgi:hypothetical protein